MKTMLSLFCGILLAVFLFATGQQAWAATPVVAEGGAEVVQYDLPYPGLLPDSPLYVLKQVRDWVLEKLITDPLKKTEFYILQADKRLVMGQMLDGAGNKILGEQTISKGEKYMYKAVQLALSLKTNGKEIPPSIVAHLENAIAKHIEVLEAEIAKAAEAQKEGLTGSLKLVQELQAELGKLQ